MKKSPAESLSQEEIDKLLGMAEEQGFPELKNTDAPTAPIHYISLIDMSVDRINIVLDRIDDYECVVELTGALNHLYNLKIELRKYIKETDRNWGENNG